MISLDSGWEFKGELDKEWRAVAQFPTTIHQDLLHHSLIPDPFLAQNEQLVQWVGERTWLYRVNFKSHNTRATLIFHGLDTFAEVSLNGTHILSADNMFRAWEVDISLKEDNELLLRFDSALLQGRRLAQQHPHKWGCWNGEPSRLAVRKAQYSYGWDWGPMLMTCGPWRRVEVREVSRILDFAYFASLSANLDSAEVRLVASCKGGDRVRFAIGKCAFSETVDVVGDRAEVTLTTRRPDLWYPHGYGPQSLYEIEVTLVKDGVEVDHSKKSMGLRRVEVVQRKLAQGSTFFFKVNDIPVFCGGSNWIPADSLLPRISREKYREWLTFLKKGNQVMARVWGGGIYEEDIFYELCDELGILVWQDFMFACGNYPASKAFLKSVAEEASYNIKRLRCHPCVVAWAGNNEDYQYAESEGLQYDPSDKDPANWLRSDFPARYIYEHVLPEAMRELASEAYYQPGCPWSFKSTRDSTRGDIHQWNVWHGTQEPYQNWPKLAGRFVSEFGMQAFPDAKTIDYFLETKDERYSQSSTMDFHNKAAGQERRLAVYLAENVRYDNADLDKYIYATQLMQAECLAGAYRAWKRLWKADNEQCGGALVWQLNDCWPGISWSIADYFVQPKPAYFAIKRELATVTVSIARGDKLEVWATNLGEEIHTVLRLAAWTLKGETVPLPFEGMPVTLPKNGSAELFEKPLKDLMSDSDVVIAAYLEGYARTVNWLEPLKYLHFSRPEIRQKLTDNSILLSADVPVKGVLLKFPEPVELDDNCVDLVPGEVLKIGFRGRSQTPSISAYGSQA